MISTKLIDTADKVLELVIEKKHRIDFLKSQKNRVEGKLNSSLKKKEKLSQQLYLDTGALEALNVLIEKVNESSLVKLSDLVNKALPVIFDDRDFTFKHEIRNGRGGKSLHFLITERKPDGSTITADVRDAMGDGIRTTIGLIIIMFYLMITESNRFIALDEVVASVADEYVENLFMFLRSMGEKGGYTFLLVSHDPRIEPYVDRILRVKEGKFVKGESKDGKQTG